MDTPAQIQNPNDDHNNVESFPLHKNKPQSHPQNIKYVLIFLLILAVSVIIFFAFNFFTKTKTDVMIDQPTVYNGPTEKIVLGNFTGIYSLLNLIAQDKGYFKQNGLDVEMKEFDTAPPEIDALLAGKVDVAIASDFTGVRYIFADNNLRILSQISKQDVFELIARKSNKLSKLSDLKGKKIGVTKKSVGEFFLGQFLTFNNISLKDVVIVDLPTAEIVNQLDQGKIDAAVLYDPYSYNMKMKLGNSALVLPVQSDQKIFALSFTTQKYINEHPEILQRYLRALLQAQDYIKNNNGEVKSYVAKAFKYDDAYVQYVWPKINFDLSLEQSLLLTMEGQARFSIDNKLTDKTKVPNYLDFIYLDALQKIKPSAVTVIH